MDLQALQDILRSFEKEYWIAPKGKEQQTRHIVLHLGKLLGKVSSVSEKHDHGFEADEKIIATDVVPDLLYYALSLAALYDVDLEKTFLQRLEANKQKIQSWK